jgi:hypothetical protein
MFNFKSQLLGAAAVLPIAAVGLLGSAGSANAAALVGEFSFNGGFTNPDGTSLVSLTKDALYFNPNSIAAGSTGFLSSPVSVSAQEGSFTVFNSASIRDILSFNTDTVENPFLDLGYLTIPGQLPDANVGSLNDNRNTFTLKSTSYKLEQSGANVSIDVQLWGYFTSATGEKTQGAGNLTFQRNNRTVAQVQTTLNNGGSLSNLTFSGGVFSAQAVPEPTTMLGLGLVAAGMTVARRRKLVKA